MEIAEPLRKLVNACDDARETGDADRLASFYADDGAILLPTGQPVAGRDAIEVHFSNMSPVKDRDKRRMGPRKLLFFPPIVHAKATATGRHGEKHSFIDILVQQADGSFRFTFSSWTLR